LAEEKESPVYRVEDIIRPDHFVPEILVGVGGGAQGLIPVVAEKMNLVWQVPHYAMVANAIGAALARPTLNISLRADTADQEYTVPELGLRKKCRSGGLDWSRCAGWQPITCWNWRMLQE